MIPLIVADDFSGACDSAARAAAHGYRAAAVLDPDATTDAGLLAISTETRHLAPDAARACLRALAPLLASRQIYKKIDSTLRGPWIDEVDELLAITDYSQAIVCPAFPAMGRTVRDGWLLIDGEPIERIVCPFTVRDALTEDDLARIASEVCSSILPVGSAGLAFHVFRRDSSGPRARSLAPGHGRWVVLIGSDHAASLAQLQFLGHRLHERIAVNPNPIPDRVAGIFATGGETASRFLRDTGAQGVAELREILPGIAAGLILGGRYNRTVMVTKAGGFGAPDTIFRAIQVFL